MAAKVTGLGRYECRQEWREFRNRFLLTQAQLAEAMGISRRTVQIVESGNSNDPRWSAVPQMETQKRFVALKAKYEAARKKGLGAIFGGETSKEKRA